MIKVKRAYEKAEPGDGVRYLVDRLWPRGLTKASLKLDGWVKELAPTQDLRRWFNHEPEKWDEFRRRYFAELDANPDAWAVLIEATQKGPVTLIYSAHDPDHNNAVVLAEYLKARQAKSGGKRESRTA